MPTNTNHYAKAEMAIRKPIDQVYEAFINPAITTKFWFTKSSGKLEKGKQVEWAWEMYGVTAPVQTLELEPNKKILIEWGTEKQKSKVVWTFKSISTELTYVEVTNYDFEGTGEELISQIRDSTGGFTIVLAGLKAFLEHNVVLNLIGDKFPEEMR